MTENKLPTLSVLGKEEDLVRIESILIMLGYDSYNEAFNEDSLNFYIPPKSITANGGRKCVSFYCIIPPSTDNKIFKASEIDKIIDYVLNFKPTK